jgi:uncharacterized protein (TIGR00369 family)
MTGLHAPDATSFEPLPAHLSARWSSFANWDVVYFPTFIGMEVEELRTDYARMRLTYRPELNQPAGVVHGGALASLIDTVVVPAIGSRYEEPQRMLTLSMAVQYLGAIREEDAIGQGWVSRRGRSIVFCEAVVESASGVLAATGSLVYKISAERS